MATRRKGVKRPAAKRAKPRKRPAAKRGMHCCGTC